MQEGVTVTAEAHAPISEEMVEEVTEAAKEAIEEEVKAEDETMIDAQKEGEQLETVEVTTTITANEDGTIETETHEKPLSAVEEPQVRPYSCSHSALLTSSAIIYFLRFSAFTETISRFRATIAAINTPRREREGRRGLTCRDTLTRLTHPNFELGFTQSIIGGMMQ